MSRTCLGILCGLPAAGKSRLARELRDLAIHRGWAVLLMTYDELIPARDWSEDEWKQQRKTVLTCLETLMQQRYKYADNTHTDQAHTHHTHAEHAHADHAHAEHAHAEHAHADHTHAHHAHAHHAHADHTHTHHTHADHAHADHTHTHHAHADHTHTHHAHAEQAHHTHTENTKSEHTHADDTHSEHIHAESDIWMQMHRQMQHTNTQPLLVLLDDNFYYQSMRYQIYQLARKYSMGFCQMFVQCPLNICLQRNQRRSLRVPDDVILQMFDRMEPPNTSRNSWEQHSLTVDSTALVTDEDVQKLMDFLESALKNPLSPFQENFQQKEADRQICASNVLHQADQMCRRLISQAMTSARENLESSDGLKVLAKKMNELKTRFLQELKKEILHQISVYPEEPMNIEKLLMTAARAFERDTQHCVQTQIKQR